MIWSLFGCTKREHIGGPFLLNSKTGRIEINNTQGGSMLPTYKSVPTNHPKSFKYLGGNYGADKEAVFYLTYLVNNADPKEFVVNQDHPKFFGNDTQRFFYKQHEVPGFSPQSVTIHSQEYISNSDKVVLLREEFIENDYELEVHEVPVEDIPSFTVAITNQGNTLYAKNGFAKDKHWLYINNLRLPIPSANAQVLSLGNPFKIVENQRLFQLFPSYRNLEATTNQLPAQLELRYFGHIGTFKHDDYHLMAIEGFEQLKVISTHWLQDKNGLYYLTSETLLQAKTDPGTSYTKLAEFENVLQFEGGYLAYYWNSNAEQRFFTFSKEAQFLSKDVVSDQGKIYVKGDIYPRADAVSFVKVDDRDFMDKNYYYSGGNFRSPKPLPPGAYEKIIQGVATWRDFNDIKMTFDASEYKGYWNGFSTLLIFPKKWDSTPFELHFVCRENNMSVLQLPLEEQLKFYIKAYSETEQKSIFIEIVPEVTLETPYDYRNIGLSERILLSYSFTDDQIQNMMRFLPEDAVSTYIGLIISNGDPETEDPQQLTIHADVLVTKNME